MIRLAMVKAWFKIMWDNEKQLARDYMRKYKETSNKDYLIQAEDHRMFYDKLHDAWDSLRAM